MLIGSGGSGKSTLARRIGKHTGLSVIHLDREFWHIDWMPTPKPEWKQKVEAFAAGEQWIIDGNFDSTFELRWPRADLVIYLDFNTFVCLWRVIRRRRTVRPDMPDGLVEAPFFSKNYLEFLLWVTTFRRKKHRRILDMSEKYPHAVFVQLKNNRQIEEFLKAEGII